MKSTLYEAEPEAFRDSVRSFFDKHVKPFHAEWEKAGIVDRGVWLEAGKQGILGMDVPEQYGGGGVKDFRYNAVVGEETTRAGASGVGFTLHNDVVAPYLLQLTTDEQKARWLPPFVSGEMITAIAMSEPGAGSDLQGLKTSAKRDGSDFIVNGSKTFITNGINSDFVIVVAQTDPEAGARGFSLLAVERGMAGFERGRNLAKVGMHAQDTAELFFDDVLVPKANLLGAEGSAFVSLMVNLPQERLSIAMMAAAACEAVLEMSLDYARHREAFGRPIGSFQHNRFVLAEMATEARVARVFVDDGVRRHLTGDLDASGASMAKWWTTELQKKLVDQAVQLHGGYGYMTEHPVAKAFLDSRVQTIYGGTTEIQKEIIGRSLGL